MKKNGYTLVEVLTGLALMALLFISCMSLFSTSLRSLRRTDTKLTLTQTNALALRKISEEIRSVYSLDVDESGQAIYFELPKVSGTIDPNTGEYEYSYPMVGDGIDRSIYYSNGKIYEKVGSAAPTILAEDVIDIDPDPGSSYYKQAYPMFAFANIGAANGLKIMLITQSSVANGNVFNRQTLTVLLRNYR